MPSFGIHIACAKEYLKNNKVNNPQEFMDGVISVDLLEDKIKSHCSVWHEDGDLKKKLSGKVMLDNYITNNEVKNDFDLGYLFHLITDYEFYNNFFDDDFLSNLEFSDFKKIVYHDYASINEHVKSKYGITYSENISKYDVSNEEAPIAITAAKVDELVSRMSKINIEEIIEYYKNGYSAK